ncbi:hypothetical protein AB1Y20_005427 [Prymnesium parvum]|uniref:peptidylprolyl isomerase n=1 Tax=Prymnesium parvum TaxID=97485 RepID=A0AB34J6I3_PRYPA
MAYLGALAAFLCLSPMAGALLLPTRVEPACRTHARATDRLPRRLALAHAASFFAASGALRADALVKGSAPPPKLEKPKERKCKNLDECEALAAQREAEREAEAGELTFERTAGGDRIRDLKAGSGREAKAGDAVAIRYRVMRLGTKARDGLSGEGQTIFSLGFGEDDDKEGDVLPVSLDAETLVPGIEAALVGMRPGGRRRVLVRPERGWKDQSASCAGIVFKADIGAAVENEAACLNKTKLPLPRSYGAKQRFARRFDESLLVELDLIDFVSKSSLLKKTGQYYDRCEQNPFADGCSS